MSIFADDIKIYWGDIMIRIEATLLNPINHPSIIVRNIFKNHTFFQTRIMNFYVDVDQTAQFHKLLKREFIDWLAERFIKTASQIINDANILMPIIHENISKQVDECIDHITVMPAQIMDKNNNISKVVWEVYYYDSIILKFSMYPFPEI